MISKKKVKKFLSRLMPKGVLKERIKLKYYSFIADSKNSFGLIAGEKTLYETNHDGLNFKTVDPLYNIVPDFDYYLHFHELKAGQVVIDAGANKGYLSLLFSKMVGSIGRVFAFEPDHFNIEFIRENSGLNSGTENITIEESLLWNQNTEIDFYEAGTVGSSAVWIPDSDKVVKKKAVTIDSWAEANNIERLDFIKMDIEGAELEAIEGCRNVIEKFKPDFAIASYHIVNGEPTWIKLEQMFSEMNYPCKTIAFTKAEIITFAGMSVPH